MTGFSATDGWKPQDGRREPKGGGFIGIVTPVKQFQDMRQPTEEKVPVCEECGGVGILRPMGGRGICPSHFPHDSEMWDK